jgi:hypothetical protein
MKSAASYRSREFILPLWYSPASHVATEIKLLKRTVEDYVRVQDKEWLIFRRYQRFNPLVVDRIAIGFIAAGVGA